MPDSRSLPDAKQPWPRDPRVPFCKGGAATCEICVGSCGIEEYEAYIEDQEIERARLR